MPDALPPEEPKMPVSSLKTLPDEYQSWCVDHDYPASMPARELFHELSIEPVGVVPVEELKWLADFLEREGEEDRGERIVIAAE